MKVKKQKTGLIVKKYDRLPKLFFLGSQIRPFLDLNDTTSMACYHIKSAPHVNVVESYHKKATELIWVISGSGEAIFETRRVLIKKGSILLIPPFTPHGFKSGARGLEVFSVTTPRVDSEIDFYSRKNSHGDLKVLSGQWTTKSRH